MKNTSERVTASCGHSVNVRMTADPELNIELLKEAVYLYCSNCQKPVRKNTDTRQAEYTELTAACGELVYVRLEQDPIKAAEMIVAFTSMNCARRACRAEQPQRQSTRNILWADLP